MLNDKTYKWPVSANTIIVMQTPDSENNGRPVQPPCQQIQQDLLTNNRAAEEEYKNILHYITVNNIVNHQQDQEEEYKLVVSVDQPRSYVISIA